MRKRVSLADETVGMRVATAKKIYLLIPSDLSTLPATYLARHKVRSGVEGAWNLKQEG